MYNKDLVEDAKQLVKETLGYYRYVDLSVKEHRESFEKDLKSIMRTFRDWGLEVVMDENHLFRFRHTVIDFEGQPLMMFERRF